MKRLLVLLLIILAEAGGTAACSSSCSSWCSCDNRGLSSVPQDLPTTITDLSLSYNVITTLSQSDFSRYNSLTILYLQYNRISTINRGAFYNLTRLTQLRLYNNQLTSLRPDMFVGLDSLQYLGLYHNNIHSIEAGAFNATCGHLPRLQTLWLSHNRINIFPSDLLLNLNISVLSDLTLNDNQMETLPAMAYDILASVSTVDINNNPWQCDCRMLPFKQRMTGSYSFENQTTCAGPANLTGKSLLWDVNPDDLICEETTTEIYSSPSGSSPVTRSTQQFHPESSPTTAPTTTNFHSESSPTTATSTTNFHSQSSPTTAPSTTNFHSESSPTDTLSTTKFPSGVTEDSTASSPASFSLSAFLSGFLGGIVGSLLTSTLFLAIWCIKMRVKPSPAPVPDPSHVYTNTNGAAPGPTSGLHHTGQGASPSQAADSDVVESRQGTSGTVPPPRSFDKSYAVLRTPLPPIKTAGPQGDGRTVPEAAHGDAAADNSVPLGRHFIYQQTFPSRLPKGLAGL